MQPCWMGTPMPKYPMVIYLCILCAIICAANTNEIKGCRNDTNAVCNARAYFDFETDCSHGHMDGSIGGQQDGPKHICDKIFKISIVAKEPYSLSLLKPIEMMLDACCGTCGKRNKVSGGIERYNIINRFTALPDISVTSIRDSDIVFPILGRASTNYLYGYKFIPLLDAPSVYYFTRKVTQSERVQAFLL